MGSRRSDPIRDLSSRLVGEIAGFGVAGLSLRLAALRRTVERAYPVTVALDISDPEAADGLSPALTTMVHRLALEAALEIARDAGAALIRLGLRIERGNVVLHIDADGSGLVLRGGRDDAALGSGKGPEALALRVAALGGALRLDRRGPARRIEITLPREPQAQRSGATSNAVLPIAAAK